LKKRRPGKKNFKKRAIVRLKKKRPHRPKKIRRLNKMNRPTRILMLKPAVRKEGFRICL
jgi:hypothetical protein